MADETIRKQRLSFRKSAVRLAASQEVSIGTKANTTLFMSMEFSVSVGPIATASESARLCVPRR
jgi:hypothetical protein